jgi:hypothetical protein
MATDTGKAPQFPRHLHAADAVQLVSRWLRSLFVPGAEATHALRCLILELATQRTSYHTVSRRAQELPSLSLLGKWWRDWRASHSLAEWEATLDAALRAPWERLLSGERVFVILDWHSVPYWGRVPAALEAIVRRGPAQSGTTRFFVYASAALLWRGMRIQVAFTWVGPAESQEAVTTRLVERVQRLGCSILGWVMDKGFYATGVVALLRQKEQPYLIAAPRRGTKQGIAALLSKAEAQYGFQEAEPPSLTYEHTLTSMDKSVAPQPTTVIVGWEPVTPPKEKRSQRTLRRSPTKSGQRWRAIAWIGGGRRWTTKKARRAYAPRTGFESGYRLSKGCRGRTSSRDPSWRLFLFGISLLLQNAWIWLVIGGQRTLHRRWKVLRNYLPFIDFCYWIVRFLEGETGHRFDVDLPGV